MISIYMGEVPGHWIIQGKYSQANYRTAKGILIYLGSHHSKIMNVVTCPERHGTVMTTNFSHLCDILSPAIN